MSITRQLIRGNNTSVEAATLLAAQYAFDTTKNEATVGTGALAGGIRLAKKNTSEILIAAQIVANTNDYSPAGLKHAGALLISTDASRDITGLVAVGVVDTVDGREIVLYNAGSFNAVLKDQNVASAAANRFDLGGADITLQPKSSVTLRYRTQGALNRWEVKASTAGATIADGGVIARKLAASAIGLVGMINGTVVPSVGASALTVALKTLAGTDPTVADPIYAIFRNATAATGDYSVLTITAATSLVISSGSSMGVAANNTAFRLWLVGFNDAGTFRLGAVNCVSGLDILGLGAWGIASSTAEGGAGAADSAQIIYTGTAVAAKAYGLLAYLTWETGLAAAGTWSAGPTRTQLYSAGVPLPGQPTGNTVIQQVNAVASGTTIVPFDDTVPQNTEGDQYMSKAITPNSAANLLDIDHAGSYGFSIVHYMTVALFQDSVVNALATAVDTSAVANDMRTVKLYWRELAGLITSTTFKIRAGMGGAGTTTFNGSSAARKLGGVMGSYLRITEIMG